jgi:hypothetical protein
LTRAYDHAKQSLFITDVTIWQAIIENVSPILQLVNAVLLINCKIDKKKKITPCLAQIERRIIHPAWPHEQDRLELYYYTRDVLLFFFLFNAVKAHIIKSTNLH